MTGPWPRTSTASSTPATGNGRIARRFTDVSSLQRGAHVLLGPSVLLAAVRGPLKPQLTEPPLSHEEWKVADPT